VKWGESGCGTGIEKKGILLKSHDIKRLSCCRTARRGGGEVGVGGRTGL